MSHLGGNKAGTGYDLVWSKTLGLVSLKFRALGGSGIIHFKIRRPDLVPVLFTLKKKTGLSIRIIHFQKVKSDSVSISFKFKKQDQTL